MSFTLGSVYRIVCEKCETVFHCGQPYPKDWFCVVCKEKGKKQKKFRTFESDWIEITK